MRKLNKFLTIFTLITPVLLGGCATATLMDKDDGVRTTNVQETLVSDYVVAFGKPSSPIPQLPSDSLVIMGQKQSYVLTKGGAEFVNVISKLDPKRITLTDKLEFYSEKNDGYFNGKLALSYAMLAEDVTKADRDFYLQNNGEDCTSYSDGKIKAQRFCFKINLEGLVYPVANNLNTFKPLSKPYSIRIYTQKQEVNYSKAGSSAAEKLVLFPFAVAFDVVTLPFQAVYKIFD